MVIYYNKVMMLITLIRFIVTLVVVVMLNNILKGFYIVDIKTAMIFAAILTILNSMLKPFLLFLSWPIIILTFGLFFFVVNAATFSIASFLAEGVSITTFQAALIGGTIVWIADRTVVFFFKLI